MLRPPVRLIPGLVAETHRHLHVSLACAHRIARTRVSNARRLETRPVRHSESDPPEGRSFYVVLTRRQYTQRITGENAGVARTDCPPRGGAHAGQPRTSRRADAPTRPSQSVTAMLDTERAERK